MFSNLFLEFMSTISLVCVPPSSHPGVFPELGSNSSAGVEIILNLLSICHRDWDWEGPNYLLDAEGC